MSGPRIDNPSTLIPRSALPGVAWPAVPSQQAATLLAALHELEQSQWWTAEQLQAHQFKQLQALLAHACKTSPWYRERLAANGYRPGETLTPKRWAQLPLLQREELQLNADALLCENTPAGHGRRSTTQTSGSTGQPVKVVHTGLTQFYWRAFTLRDHLWHGRDLGARLAIIRHDGTGQVPPEGSLSQGWGAPADLVYPTGPSGAMSITTDVARQADWLRRFDPNYLLTYPSNLTALAEHCRDHGLTLPGLREIRTISETLSPRTRELCRDTWGVPVVDVYSSQELGYLTLQCPEHEHHHVQCENVLLEVLDDQGRPCGPGQIGRVVATSLHNFAMPLIRYVIEDYAEVGEPCPCGRGLPVIKRIVGRERNMLRLPSGERHWPLVGFAAFADIAPVRQFQFIQRSLQRIDANLVVDRPLTKDEQRRLKTHIQAALGYPFELVLHYPASIPRRANGKFEEFISELV